MNNIDELNAQLLDARVEQNARREESQNSFNALHEFINKVLKKNIHAVCDDADSIKIESDNNGARIKVGKNYGIDLYFEKDPKEEKRMLKINFSCFGSFGKNDVNAVKYCKVLGSVTTIMEVIEMQLFATDTAKSLWSAYETTKREFWRANERARKIENDIKDIETAVRKESILSKIAVGCKIMTNRSPYSVGQIVKTVERITGKNIIFKEDWGRRTKKHDLITNLMCNRWQIV